MMKLIQKLFKDTQEQGLTSSGRVVRGMGKIISLNAQTDFQNRIPSLRLTDREVLAKDARRIGQDMWDVLEG